ncbi:hypothetical protein OG21DRAFT_1415400 [Imleria badia]|nr:hypothetical protein OG21DRAFT_1415400 [Imleria badia]
MKSSTILGFLALALPFASSNLLHSKRHHEVANRARADVDVHKRSFSNSRFTYYNDGLGACGWWSNPGDMIVALNVEQFGPGFPGEFCGKSITIVIDGKLVVATITDKCMGCPWGGLDFSPGLFSIFAPLTVGVLTGEWWFND